MPSTYTSILGLTKQGIGENSNTWGNILNDNFIELLDNAIAGRTLISVVGTGDYTLTNTQGVVNEARSVVLETTGIASVNRNIIIPGKVKLYILIGSHTGSYTMTFKTVSGSTSVGVNPGDRKFVYCNGSDLNEIISALSPTNNLSDLTNVSAARSNLALGSLAVLSSVGTTELTDDSVTLAKINAASGGLVPTGTVFDFAGTTAPTGFLLAYGQAVSRTTYSALFALLGTTYGAGDTTTTFNLPDLRGRVIAGKDDMGGSSANRLTGLSGGVNGDTLGGTGGSETHTLVTSEIPAHTHDIDIWGVTGTGLQRVAYGNNSAQGTATGAFGAKSTGSDGAHNNVQPTFILNKIIKT